MRVHSDSMNARSCDTSRMVRSLRCRLVSIHLMVFTSMWFVGSSKMSRSGPDRSAAANATRRCLPPAFDTS
jgi:hypothetical protein